jgi:hypothetical protein
MVTTSRLKMAYAAGLAAVLALAGCGDGGGQAGGPSASVPATTSTAAVSSTASSTSTTAPVDPVLARIPAAARPETSAGAEAFTAFYFKELNRAWETGNPSPLEGLSAPDCKTCVAFFEGAQSLKDAGEHHKGETLTVTEVSAVNFVNQKRELAVHATQNAVPVVNASGVTVDTTAAGEGVFIVNLTFDGRWVVSRLQTAKS